MATDTAPDEKVHTHEEKIERLEHTIDYLKKAIEDLQRSQDEQMQHFEGRFQKLEGMQSCSTLAKQPKEFRGTNSNFKVRLCRTMRNYMYVAVDYQ